MLSAFTVRAEAMPAWVALGSALEDTTTPCQREPELFVDDSVTLRRQAAAACVMCPVINLCARFADANAEGFGVWGGVDRTPTERRRRRGGDASC